MALVDYHQNTKTLEGQYIISHSALNELDPAIGGHPKAFFKALNDPGYEKTPSLERGDLLHLWMQHKDSFVIESTDKPTEKLAYFVERFYELYNKEKYKEHPIMLQVLAQDWKLGIEESIAYERVYRIVTGRADTVTSKDPDFALFIQCVRFARMDVNYNSTLKELTALKHFEENIQYLRFLQEASGRIILTAANKEILTNCYNSIQDHPFARHLAFELEGRHEVEMQWFSKQYSIYRKCKIDKMLVDEEHKILTIIDYKTTSYPVSLFIEPNGAYNKYRCGRQLVSYMDGFFQTHLDFNSAEWTINLYNIVVQTNGEFPTIVYRVAESAIYTYTTELRSLERRASSHIYEGIWNITEEERHHNYIEIK